MGRERIGDEEWQRAKRGEERGRDEIYSIKVNSA
jgi:hypothetical protein